MRVSEIPEFLRVFEILEFRELTFGRCFWRLYEFHRTKLLEWLGHWRAIWGLEGLWAGGCWRAGELVGRTRTRTNTINGWSQEGEGLEHGGVPWLPGVADNGVAGDWNSQLLPELLLWSLLLVSALNDMELY